MSNYRTPGHLIWTPISINSWLADLINQNQCFGWHPSHWSLNLILIKMGKICWKLRHFNTMLSMGKQALITHASFWIADSSQHICLMLLKMSRRDQQLCLGDSVSSGSLFISSINWLRDWELFLLAIILNSVLSGLIKPKSWEHTCACVHPELFAPLKRFCYRRRKVYEWKLSDRDSNDEESWWTGQNQT